jgi:hypothetical protein
MASRIIVILSLLVLANVAIGHSTSSGHFHEQEPLTSDLLKPNIAKYGHKCVFDERAAHTAPAKRVDQSFDVFEIAKDGTRIPVKREATAWLPFRITVVLDNLNGDANTCYNAGASVQADGVPYTCTANDILVPDKLTYLNESMIQAAVHRFAELLKVDRVGPITVADNSGSGCEYVPLAFPQLDILSVPTTILLM